MPRPLPCAPTVARLALALCLSAPTAAAQLTDVTQAPNAISAGIKKSLVQQVGAGRGDLSTPDSSWFLIARDPFRSIVRGRQLFQRKFTVAQGLGPRFQDGIGQLDVHAALGAGVADSCAGCHSRPFGSAGFGGNVFTRPDSRDAPHLFGLGLKEMLADEITAGLRDLRAAAGVQAVQQGTPVTVALVSKGISYGALTARPDGSFDTSAVEGVDPDLRVRPFFAHGGTISIREFVVGALKAEMGLEAADPDLARAVLGHAVVTPSGMRLDGSLDAVEAPPVATPSQDGDQDGVADEVPASLVDHLEFYLLNYFRPATGPQTAATIQGRATFEAIGCAACHVPELVIERDRRVADVDTRFDPQQSNEAFSRLYATAEGRFDTTDDGSGWPALKRPRMDTFRVKNLFTDFKRHDLGQAFHERNFDGTRRTHFLTTPLWGVASTPPYGHDGRSLTLEDAIVRHGGEALAARDAFTQLGEAERQGVLEFLGTLVLFAPPDTPSNLAPTDPTNPLYPLEGHGSIDLSVLFNVPTDKE